MARYLPYAVALVILLSAFFLPEAAPARLAAMEADQLLELPVGPAPAEGERDTRRPLWAHVFDGPAAERDGKELSYRLYGVRIGADVDSQAIGQMTIDTRRSLVRGLRKHAENEKLELDLQGELKPVRGGGSFYLQLIGPELVLEYVAGDEAPLVVSREFFPPLSTSLLPPIVAVALAIVFRKPLIALFCGILVGVFLHKRTTSDVGVLTGLASSVQGVFQTYFKNELVDNDRLLVIGFVVFMFAMVGVITRVGGIRGLMNMIARLANSAKSSQVATYLMGLTVFFDDYANTILVGSSMRPLTDRFKVAREKLAYIVDSTAAPVAGLSIFSTWIAFEVSTFSAQLPAANLTPNDGYSVFLQTLPFRFYCIFTLLFVAMVTITGRDFGPLLRAERRARSGGGLVRKGSSPMISERATAMKPVEGIEPKAWRAIVPLAAFILVTIFEIFRRGGAHEMALSELFSLEGITAVIGAGSGYWPLFIGSLSGFVLATVAAWRAGMTTEIPRAAGNTLLSMWVAFAILYLAWMIGAVCKDLGTASYLSAVVGDTIDPMALPALLFLLSGFVAFSTGSSWSTMSILLPLVVGLAYSMGASAGMGLTPEASGHLLMVISIGAVLEGSIFGDHCSPISDTTVMSSIASASDHIDHVRTQAPYALVTMTVALLVGYLPATYLNLSPWIGLALGTSVLFVLLLWIGKRTDAAPAEEVLGGSLASGSEPS